MDEKSLIFYHIVNDNRQRKEEEWANECGCVLVPVSNDICESKFSKFKRAIVFAIQGIGAVITAVLGFGFMAIMTLIV